MSTLEEGWRELLGSTNAAAFTALVGNRLYPARAPENTRRPYAVYSVVSRVGVYTHDPGPATDAVKRIQHDFYGDTVAEAITVAEAFRTSVDGYKGSSGATHAVDIQCVTLVPDFTDWDDDAEAYRTTRDAKVWHKES